MKSASRPVTARCDLRHRPGGQVRLVADPQRCAAHGLVVQERGRLEIGPAQVGCEQQPAGSRGDDPGQSKASAHQSGALCLAEHLLAHGPQAAERRAWLAADEVVVLDVFGHHATAQVNEPGGEVAGVDLQAERHQPAARDERDGWSARSGHRGRLELRQHPSCDEIVDQPRNGRASHRGAGSHAGARQRSWGRAHRPGHQGQVALPQGGLPRAQRLHAWRIRPRGAGSGGCRHPLTLPSGFYMLSAKTNYPRSHRGTSAHP